MTETKEVTPSDYYKAWKEGKLREFVEEQEKKQKEK